jgi:8-oxo-dGTP diphosphatase
MPHIHTAAGEHDPTTSAFIVHEGKQALLLHRHRKLGILLQPGGHIELIEHPWSTMAHELQEETGYELHQLSVLQTALPIPGLVETSHPLPLAYRTHPFPVAEELHFHTDAAYGFVTSEDPLNKPHEGESQELYWMTVEELSALTDEEIPADARTIGLHLLNNLANYLRVPADSFAH